MVTAEDLFKDAHIEPGDFGADIVDPEASDEDKRSQAIDHIESQILRGAMSEVDVPLMSVSSGNTLPLPDPVFIRRFPAISPEGIIKLNDSFGLLYDAAVKSYARSEINKQVDTNTKSYDEDSDSDRKTADAQLEKLLSAIRDVIVGNPEGLTEGEIQGFHVPSQSLATEIGF